MNTTQRSRLIGLLELSGAQFTVGSNIVIAKYLLAFLPIYMLVTVRFIVGLLILMPFTLISGQWRLQSVSGASLNTKDYSVLFLQAICAGFLFNIFIVNGMQYSDAVNAGIITSTLPACIALLSWWFLKERPTSSQMLAIILAVAGIMVLNLGKASHHAYSSTLWGNFLIVLAVIPEAVFTILAKVYSHKIAHLTAATILTLINTILMLPFGLSQLPISHFNKMGVVQWLLIIYYGGSGTILFFTLWYRGIAKVDTATAALFTAVMPVSATLLAAVFLHEIIPWTDIVGMCVVIFSIILGAGVLRYPAAVK